jgi:hypothetical protein
MLPWRMWSISCVSFTYRDQVPGGGDVFEVSYQGSDQDKVLRVTNALAAKFIEENLRFRQELASQTSIYVKDELEMAKEVPGQKRTIDAGLQAEILQ